MKDGADMIVYIAGPMSGIDNYNRPAFFAAARSDLVGHYQQFFYAAIAIALHRLYGFGETRIIRTLDNVQTIMAEEICSCDIIQRCRTETGLDILDDEYTS